MTFASKRFEVKSNPWSNLGVPGLANLSDFMPGDDERLKWIYTQYMGNNASFNPYLKEFYPNYNDGFGGGGGGRGTSGDPMLDRIPRLSPINEGIFNESSNGCPAGFYQFGKVCVPSVDTRGGSGSDLAAGPGSSLSEFFGKGDARGLINAITPPQFTQKNQEFIVLTDVQNIGGKPAKFYTKVTIPDLNITNDVSNSTMIMPLAKLKIGHRIIMPLTVTSNNLLNAKVELMRLNIDGSSLTSAPTSGEIVDDVGSVSIPSPNYRGPLPPIGGGLVGGPNGNPYGGPMTNPRGFPMFPPSMPPMIPGGGQAFPGPIMFPPNGPYPNMINPQIMVNPYTFSYPAGSTIYVTGSGFVPNETVAVQLYSITNTSGIVKFLKRLTTQSIQARFNGMFPGPVAITIPTRPGSTKVAVVAYGSQSKKKVQQVLELTGVDSSTPPSSGGGGINFGSNFPFGNMFGDGGLQGWMQNLFNNVGIGNQSGQNVSIQNPGGPNQVSHQSSNVIPNNMFGDNFPFGNNNSSGFINPAQNTQGFINNLFANLGMR